MSNVEIFMARLIINCWGDRVDMGMIVQEWVGMGMNHESCAKLGETSHAVEMTHFDILYVCQVHW